MIIVVEGPDNSGKSTLIRHLANQLGVNVIPGEGPGRSDDEINERVRRYATMDNVIFDRHPCVSQPLYNHFRSGGPQIDPQLLREFYDQDVIFIFCRGRMSLTDHVIKDHDMDVTDAAGIVHADTVRDNHLSICATYEEWAMDHAHFTYRIGDGFRNVTAFVRTMMFNTVNQFDPIGDIFDFHFKFGLEYEGPPRVLPPDLAKFRIKFVDEEANEYCKHEAAASAERFILTASASDPANYAFHLEHMLDGLVDLVYVAIGTSHLHGFDFREAWRRVHAANMKKVRAKSADDSKRGSTWDVVKPEGWSPPSHIDLVEVNDLTLLHR